MTRRIVGVSLLVLSTCLLVCAASSSRWDHVPAKDHARLNPYVGTAGAAAAGALLYQDHCQQCHMANGIGDGHKRPSLRNNQRLRAATDGDIEWFLRQGDLGHGMPSWSSLPEAQRWQLVAYLRSMQ